MIVLFHSFVTLLYALNTQSIWLPKIFSNNMVLQAENPTIYGYAETANATVTATIDDTGERLVSKASGPDNLFIIEFKPRAPSFKGTTITLSESTFLIQLKKILFGDVWLCSGQSNMEFSVAEMFNASEIIKAAAIPGLRLFAVQKNASKQPTLDLIETQYPGGWVKSSPESICGAEYGLQSDYCEPHCGPSVVNISFKRPTWGYFSAVCFIHGAELARAHPDRPFGLIESCWGGTNIQSWSSGDALKSCDPTHASGIRGGNHWNSMVVPLLNFPIKGTIWYQGEANSKITQANNYTCQMKAMIRDWRTRWRRSSNFIFNIVQLAPSGDSSGGILRWSQKGATMDPELSGVGLAITIDLYDRHSPCGAVHIRNKTSVGKRIARASLALAYDHNITWTGPNPQTFMITEASKSSFLLIGFESTGGSLEFRNVSTQTSEPQQYNIEITSDKNLLTKWIPAFSSLINATHLKISLAGLNGTLSGVRYAWNNIPRGQFIYGGDNLPAGPFIARCDSRDCTFVPPGEIPVDPKDNSLFILY